MTTLASYTVADLVTSLASARAMMARSGAPTLRLTRTCDDDSTMRRMIENADPFQHKLLTPVTDVYVCLWQ